MIGYSFSRDAREEVARVNRREKIEIILHRAQDLLAQMPLDRIVQQVPVQKQLSLDEYLVPRAPKERRTLDELVTSELDAQRRRTA
jgi:hypothetical protein